MELTKTNFKTNDNLINNAYELFNSLSDDKMQEAYNYSLYLKDKEEWEATMELCSHEVLNKIKAGLAELNSGQYVKFEDIKRNV